MNDPQELKPKLSVTLTSKLPMLLFLAGVLFMVFVLIYSINNTKEEEGPVQEEIPIEPKAVQPSEQPDGKHYGISGIPDPPKDKGMQPDPEKKDPPKPQNINIIREKPTSKVQERYDAELGQVRAWRIALYKKALEAPMRVEVKQAVATTASESATELSATEAGSYTPSSKREVRRIKSDQIGTGEISKQIASLGDHESAYADREDKEQFGDRSTQTQWTSPYRRTPSSSYEIKTGTLIPSILLTAINSDLPGKITAQVSQHVWDTATGKYLLIPQGTRLYGVYDSRIIEGQERVLIAWNRLVFPDASSMTLEAFPGADQAGQAGMSDKVNNHFWKTFGSALLTAVITGAAAYAVDTFGQTGSGTNDSPTLQSELGTSLATTLGQLGANMFQQNMEIKPTLQIRPGYSFNVHVNKDLLFQEPYSEQGKSDGFKRMPRKTFNSFN